ncbi:MAG: dephospho-CoA kinase [Gammaproteobacteria bacterium]|nr:MAG: dephospho-CoA kinase [Gammaproteobacteria bacterium]
MSRALIVGLTGGIASGKTTVANYLAAQGAHLIDTDIIAREVVAPNAPTTLAIVDLLGADCLLPDGNLNRAHIKQRIFNDDILKDQYEAIILPAIRQATLAALDSVPVVACYAVLIVPLLFEKGLDKYCDYTVCVDLPVEEQIHRAIARKPDDEAVIRQIIAAQMPRQERNAHADSLIDNHVGIAQLHAQLDELHQLLLHKQATLKKLLN